MEFLKYAVVEFPQEEVVEVVSIRWLDETKTTCHWPLVMKKKLNKLISNHATPESHPSVHWSKYPCRFMKECDTYQQASRVCQRAQYTSNLESSALEDTPCSSKSGFRTKKRLRTTNRSTQRKLVTPDQFSSENSDTDSSETSERLPSFNVPPQSLLSCNTQGSSSTNVFEQPSVILDGSSQGSQLFVTEPRLGLVVHNSELNTTHQNPPTANLGCTAAPTRLDNSTNSANETATNSQSTVTLDSENTVRRLSELQQSFEVEKQKNRRFQDWVVEKLVGLGNDVTELLRRSTADTATLEPCQYQLPVKTTADYDGFCVWLNDPVNLQNLIPHLTLLGGHDKNHITTRILGHLISNDLATQMSLTGKGKKAKVGIKDTGVFKLICVAVRATKGGEDTTDFEIQQFIKTWLKNSSDRQGGRDRRRLARTDLAENQDA